MTSVPAFVITISGVSGAGKSTLVRAVAERLGNATCLHFDDYGEQMEQPENGLDWIAAGADRTAFRLPAFGQDVRRLRQGEVVISPTGRRIEPAPFLVLEEPFGSGRSDMKGLVNLSVCIDLPMEIALARRLLDVVGRWEGTAEARMEWIGGYLKSYLFEGMREVYKAINAGVEADCDLLLDGTKPVAENVEQVVATIQQRHSLQRRKR